MGEIVAVDNTIDVASMSLQQIRAIRRGCAETTPGHRPYPNTCDRCNLGIAFVPNEGPQEEFVSSDVDELLYGGAAGGGKTAGLVSIPLRWVDNPAFRGLLLRRDTTQLEQLLDEADALFPVAVEGADRVMKGNGAVWSFPSGAKIRFEHCQLEKHIRRYDGKQFQYVGYDELTHFTLKQFVGINARLRSPALGLPRYARGTTNPGGEGHEWVFDRWGAWLNPKAKIRGLAERRDEFGEMLPPARPGEVLWFDPTTGERVAKGSPKSISRTFIPAKVEDNPYIMVNDPEYVTKLMGLDPVRRAQLRRGDWLAKPGKGIYFKRAWFKMADVRPTDVVARIRVWDLAATEESPDKKKRKSQADWTVGELWAKTRDDRFYVENVIRFRGTPAEVDNAILNTAISDGKGVAVRLPQDPGQAGKAQAAHFVRMLQGFTVRIRPVTGDKVTRAGPYSSQVEHGNVWVLEGDWNAAFFEEHEAFPEGSHDDQIDCGSDAIAELAGDKPFSADLQDYRGNVPRDQRTGDSNVDAQGQWTRPASHGSDADKPKRGRW